jgi:DNA-binding transcriptional ArsR family regulator
MKKLLTIEEVSNVSKMLKVLAHPTRIKIVEFLESGEKKVGDVQNHIKIDQPGVSQHLKRMYINGILNKRREGVCIYYSLNNLMIEGIMRCIRKCEYID